MKRFLLQQLWLFAIFFSFVAYADLPLGYYDAAVGKKAGELKTTMGEIIKTKKVLSYANLWTGFYQTDNKGDNRVWDMYSYKDYFFTTPGSSVSGMNKEHAFPKSWWGGEAVTTQAYSDLHHLAPSDGPANLAKSNFPLGEVDKSTFDNGSCKVGSGKSTIGYTEKVFEPNDDYKGDFARMYMYVVTCYPELNYVSPMIKSADYPVFSDWALSLLLRWGRDDQVSQKEIDRNEAVYKIQQNRNPYIDFPDLAEYVWGLKMDDPFDFERQDFKVLLDVTFMSGLAPFKELSVTGADRWLSDQTYGAKMSGFSNGINNENEDWLISPALDLSNAINTQLTFSHALNKGLLPSVKTKHTLWATDQYTDGADPNSVAWSQVDIPGYPAGNSWTFVQSGEINLPSEFLGKNQVRLAFKYQSDNSDAATWEIKDLKFIALTSATSISRPEAHLFRGWYASGSLYLEQLEVGDKVEVYNESGQLITSAIVTSDAAEISVDRSSLLIVRVSGQSGCAVRKF